eukprot:Rmarinus@m.3651
MTSQVSAAMGLGLGLGEKSPRTTLHPMYMVKAMKKNVLQAVLTTTMPWLIRKTAVLGIKEMRVEFPMTVTLMVMVILLLVMLAVRTLKVDIKCLESPINTSSFKECGFRFFLSVLFKSL